jgi:hypothetical protein
MLRSLRRFALVPLLAGGLVGCGDAEDGSPSAPQESNLVFSTNGLSVINGLSTMNGLSTPNGLSVINGLATNGLSVINGLSTMNGLSSTVGQMTTALGRTTIEYLVRCALPQGDSITKQDQLGVSYTFAGQLGVAPAWKTGGCDATCQQAVSSCMLAHVNTTGVHIPLWLVSPVSSIGWGTNPQFPNREGTFFGNIMTTNQQSGALDAFYCNGPGFSTDTVPGRLGALQTGAPYTDPYLANGGSGDCSPCTSTRADGPSSCKADGITFKTPVTVWRAQTFQAENAVLSNGLTPIDCSGTCSNGKRVGYIGPYSTLTFNAVKAATAGMHTLNIYYSNGDCCGTTACYRYLNVSVNGGPFQQKTFGVVKAANWNMIGSQSVQLDGFVAGATNTLVFKGDTAHSAPDMDWIEVQ